MKKIVTLILAAFMATFVVSAEDIKMSVYERAGKFEEGFKLGAFVGNITSDVKYDEASKVYTITNFLGYDKANVEFKVMEDETLVIGGETRYAIEYTADKTPAEGSIVKVLNNNNYKICFELNPTDANDPKDSALRSGTVTGAEENYQFVNPTVWGVTLYTPDVYMSTPINYTYALKQGAGYKFFIEFDSVAQWIDGGEGYEYVDYPAPKSMLVFSYPDNGDDQTAITDIDADNDAPAEYYNLQGVRVDNPTAGIYICRKGDKTSKVVIR